MLRNLALKFLATSSPPPASVLTWHSNKLAGVHDYKPAQPK
jgi:hypothetical protein